MNSVYESQRFMGTKADAVAQLGITGTFDYSIPETFNDQVREFIDCPPAHYVWSYEGSMFGFPRPLTVAGQLALIKYNQKYGTSYRTDWNVVS